MIYIGDFEISTAEFMICTCIIIFAVQLVLCTYVKNLLIRLSPVILFTLAVAVFTVITFLATGWDALGYLFLAIVASFCVVSCGLAWAFFAIVRLFSKDRKRERHTS